MWAMVRMQRFFDGLRNEVEQEVQLIGDLARRRARIRVDEAHAEAARIRGGLPPPVEDAVGRGVAATRMGTAGCGCAPRCRGSARARSDPRRGRSPRGECSGSCRGTGSRPARTATATGGGRAGHRMVASRHTGAVATRGRRADRGSDRRRPGRPNVAEMPVDEPDASPNSSPDGRHTTPPAALAIVPGPTIEEAARRDRADPGGVRSHCDRTDCRRLDERRRVGRDLDASTCGRLLDRATDEAATRAAAARSTLRGTRSARGVAHPRVHPPASQLSAASAAIDRSASRARLWPVRRIVTFRFHNSKRYVRRRPLSVHVALVHSARISLGGVSGRYGSCAGDRRRWRATRRRPCSTRRASRS